MADEGAQLGIQQEINKVLQERQAILAASAKQLQDQTQIAMQLCAALKCESLDGMTEKLEGMQGALTEAADAAEKPKNSLESVGDAASGLADKLDASKVAAVGAGVGLISGFKGALGMLSSVGKGITGIVGSLGKVGATILKMPFKMMSGLIGMAQSGGGGPSPIREELEAIRGEFGDLATNEGKAVASSLGQVQSQMNDLGGTGLRMSQVYGHGPEGVAAAMKDVHELATALGPALSGMTDVIAKSGVELSMYRKGLGMTADQQAMMLKQASMAGKDPVKEMDKFASMAINMGEQFGVNAKVVGKSMAEMSADVANFGQLSVKELGKAAIYANKLGIATKDLQGVIGKFDNFEDAAKGAGEMAQAFGMNVDAMELMNAQNPAERLSMLQKAFKETGKSVEDMSRQELKMLASQSGLSEEAAKLAFSQKGLNMSYDDISKGGDKAEKKQLSQAEAMDKLATSIQKMTKGGGGGGFKGFFDAFLQGFGDGIKKSKEFRAVMKNIRKSLKVVFRAGKDIGKMFVKMFPGVKQFLKGLQGIFDPKKFSGLMKDVKKIFKGFFGDLSKDPVKATEKFIEKIQGAFKKFFGKQGSAGKDVMEGGSKILKAVKGIFKALLGIAIKGLTKLIKNIVDAIKNPKPVKTGLGKLFGDLAKEFGNLFAALLPPLGKALLSLGKTLFDKAKPHLIKFGTIFLGIVLTKMFITAALSAAKGAIIGKVGALLGKAMGKMFGAAGKAPAAMKGAAQAGTSAAKGGGMGKGFSTFIKGLGSISVKDIIKAAFKLSIMALTFIPVVKIFAFAAVEAYNTIKSANPLKVAAGMIALGITTAAVMQMAHVGQQLNPGMVGKAAIGLIAGAALLTVGAFAFGLALQLVAPAFDGVEWKKIPLAMLGLAIAAGAAFGMSIAGAAINPQLAGMALLGLLAGALLLTVGGLAFAGALHVITPVLSALPLGKVALAMLALVPAVGAAVAMTIAGAAMNPALVGLAALGLGAGALLLAGGGLAFAGALWVVMSTIGSLDMGNAAKSMLALAVVIGATMGMALAATAMLTPAATGLPGAIIGAIFLSVGALAFAGAVWVVSSMMGGLDMKKTALDMLSLMAIMALTLPMAILSTALIIPAAAGLIGILPAAAFLALTASVLGPALKTFEGMEINKDKIVNNALGLGAAMGGILVTALTAVLLTPFAIPFIGGFLMKKGLKLIGAFLGAMGKHLAGPLKDFAALPLPDGGSVGKKIDLMNAAIEGVARIGDIALGLAAIDVEAVEAGGNSGGTIDALTGFISTLLGSVGTFVTKVVELASEMPDGAGENIKAISGAISAMAGLMKAFAPSDAAMKAVTEAAGSWGGDEVGLMNSIADMQKQAMEAAVPMFGAAGAFIEQIAGAVDGIDVSSAGPLLSAIPKILDAIGGLMKSMAPSEAEMSAVSEAADSWGGDEVGVMNAINERMVSGMKSMEGLIKTIGNVMGGMITNHLKPMIEVIGNLGVDPGVIQAIADIIGGLMGAMSDMLKAVGPVMEVFQSSLEDNYVFGPSKAEQMSSMMADFGNMMSMMSKSFTDMLPMITKFVKGVIAVANTLGDPKKSSEQLKVISTAIKMLGDVTGPMIKAMDMLIKYKSGSWSSELNWYFGKGGFLDKMVDSVGRGIANYFAKIKPVMNKITDPDKAGKQLDIVATAVKSLADVTGPMMKAMDMIKKYFSEGNSWNNEVEWYFGKNGFLDTLIKSVGRGIGNYMKQVFKVTAKIKDPVKAKMQMEIITDGINAASQMLDMVSKAMKMIAKNKDSSWESELRFYFHPRKGMVVRMAKSLGRGLRVLMREILKITAKITDPKKASAQVKIVADIMAVVESFVGAISAMSALKVPGAGKTKTVGKIMDMVGGLSSQLAISMPQVIEGIVSAIENSGKGKVSKLYAYRHSIKILGTLMKTVGDFAKAIETVQALGGGNSGKANAVLKNFSDLFGPQGYGREGIKNLVEGISDIVPYLDKVPKGAGPKLKSIVEVVKAMDGVTAKKVTSVTDTMQEVKKLIVAVGDSDLKGVVDLAKVLAKPGKSTLKVTMGDPVKINATFVVNIDSKQMAKTLAATGELTAAGDGSK